MTRSGAQDRINPEERELHAWALMKVVDSVSNPKTEIHVEKAQAVKAGAAIGEFVEKEIDPSTLGRIAAQTARQAVMQRLRQFEKDRIYDDFKDQVGNIVTGHRAAQGAQRHLHRHRQGRGGHAGQGAGARRGIPAGRPHPLPAARDREHAARPRDHPDAARARSLSAGSSSSRSPRSPTARSRSRRLPASRATAPRSPSPRRTPRSTRSAPAWARAAPG